MAKTQEPGITKIEGAKGTYYRVQIRIKNGEHLSKNFGNYSHLDKPTVYCALHAQ